LDWYTLKMQAVHSFEVSVNLYTPAGRNIQLVVNFHQRRFDKLKSV